jgi:catecholate siderophore receptor
MIKIILATSAFFCFFTQIANAKKIEKNVVELPKVVVSANLESDGNVDGYRAQMSTSSTKTPTLLLDTPQSISVVTQDQIADQKITSISEALRYVPGVNIQQGESNRDQVTIRGNSTTADFFIDGMRDDMQYFRDFYNTDRVEFLKGSNAMAFGRGGSGGVINRVSKFADGKKVQKIILTGGSFNNRRAELDVGNKVNDKLSLRLNTMYEKSGTFRKYGDLERYGFNPTATINLSDNTDLKVGYEHFSDNRFNDRGIPSRAGRALNTDPSTFFGNPNENTSDSKLNAAYANFTHDFDSTLQFSNKIRYSKNTKYYRNVYTANAMDLSGNVDLAAYDNEQTRNSLINQTNLSKKFETGFLKHFALVGAEIVRQDSTSFRRTGYFNDSTTSQTVSLSNPINLAPVTYRNNGGSDTNNGSEVRVYSTYLQDQVDIGKYVQLTAGLRYDNFEVNLKNHQTGVNFKRSDDMISPRLGLVLKPKEDVSIYASYSTTYLPSSGDQFSSLAANSAMLKPEKMQNYEIGFKWDVNPRLNFSTSIYQLDRTNTRANDPNNVGFFVLTGSSRTRGVELAINGKVSDKWQVIAAYALQDAVITGENNVASTAVKAGKVVGLVPRNTASLWNKYDVNDKFAAGLGVVSQSSQFATVDNTVKLNGFVRFDAALYYKINNSYRAQLNIENLSGLNYIQTAHNNNNIQPGSPRAFRFSVIANF